MDITTFLKHAQQPDFLSKHPLIVFKGAQKQEYPLLFFSLLITYLKKNSALPLESLDIVSGDRVALTSKLETSFLCNSMAYWLKNVSELLDPHAIVWLSSYTAQRIIGYTVVCQGQYSSI